MRWKVGGFYGTQRAEFEYGIHSKAVLEISSSLTPVFFSLPLLCLYGSNKKGLRKCDISKAGKEHYCHTWAYGQ
jgi:hypothetical protein